MSSTFVPKVAIVTGAGQGIGREVALRLAADGLDIAVNDIPSGSAKVQEVIREIQALNRRAIPILADVSDEKQVEAMVEKTVAELGGLDVMVANAGIAPGSSVVDMPVDNWDRVMAVNVRGTLLCYKHAARQMIKQGRGGRIIGASSAHGKQGSKALPAYTASKFAIRGLTQSTAGELAPHNITVNAYAPGLIISPMTTSETDKELGVDGEALAVFLGIPGCPRANPDAIASIVSYLVKPEAHFITGQSVSVNGGLFMD